MSGALKTMRRDAALLMVFPIALVLGMTAGAYDPESQAVTGELGPVDPSGWAWPSDTRSVTQGFHDGFSIDLASTPGGPLYAPYDGVVVVAGFDGGMVPAACLVTPSWWRGPNHTVIIEHTLPDGRIVFSSHNHVQPESSISLGIRAGSKVRAGQQVALSGMSGCTSGPHTHFTLTTTQRNTNADVNPGPILGPPAPN